ncbi:hypothetical protein ACS0TY_001823 [Phlomoides rotata]
MAPNQEIKNPEKGESSSTEKMNTPSGEQKKLNNEQILTPEEAKLKALKERKARYWTDWNNFAPGRQTGDYQDYPKSIRDDVRWIARMFWRGLVNRILKPRPPGKRAGW